MGCIPCAAKTAKVTYEHQAPDGTRTAYKSEIEARQAVVRKGGTYRKV